MLGHIPKEDDKGNIDEKRVKSTLPGRDQCLEQAGATFVLSDFSDDEVFMLPKEGKKQPSKLFTEEKAIEVFDNFQDRLQEIEVLINLRNQKLDVPYETLLPSRIPYGIAS